MKKLAKIFVCILLLSSVILSLASCDAVNHIFSRFNRRKPIVPTGISDWYEGCPVPEGYTGGLTYNYQIHAHSEFKWLETYEEMVDAVTRLRAHGTEIAPIPFFDCEKYGYDVKFCLSFPRKAQSEELSEGQNYFDRKIVSLSISAYVFFEYMSIDELMYDSVYALRHFYIHNDRKSLKNPDSNDVISIEKYKMEHSCIYYVYYNNNESSGFRFKTLPSCELSEEEIAVLEKTLVVIE